MLHRRFGWFGASYFCVLTYIWKPFQGKCFDRGQEDTCTPWNPLGTHIYNQKGSWPWSLTWALRAGSSHGSQVPSPRSW